MGILERYGRFVGARPYAVLALCMLAFLAGSAGSSLIKQSVTDFSKEIPKDVPSIQAFNFISDEFGNPGSSVLYAVELDPRYANSTEPRDIRDPGVMAYMDLLTQKARTITQVTSATSAADLLRQQNGGHLPGSAGSIRDIMASAGAGAAGLPGFDVQGFLNSTESGLGGLEGGIAAQQAIIQSLLDGLHGSGQGIGKARQGLLGIESSLSGQGPQLQASIGAAIALVSASSATPAEKAQITAVLQGLAAASEGSSGALVQGLAGVDQGLQGVGAGIAGMQAAASALNGTNAAIGAGVQGIEQGITQAGQAASLFLPQAQQSPEMALPDPYSQYISSDYSIAVVSVSFDASSDQESEEVVNELLAILDETPRPPGVTATLTGSAVTNIILMNQIGPTFALTGLLSFASIFVIVVLVFASLRYGLTSLLAIVFGSTWAFGFAGFAGIGLSPQSSGALSLILGIGVDFGIQVVTRYRQELRASTPQEAAERTMPNVIAPMTISALAIFLGFQSLSFANLKFIGDLGNIMSLGVIMSYFAAITVVPAVLVILNTFSLKRFARRNKVRGGR
jgi:predicted RND superfamily exporter protein